MRITLCGSTRFEKEFHEWDEKLTLVGHVVYSLSVYPSSKDGNKDWYDDTIKTKLDLAHLAKISNSDAIIVLNVDGYFGDSTRREIVWARMQGKQVYWLVPPPILGTTRSAYVAYTLLFNDFGEAVLLL